MDTNLHRRSHPRKVYRAKAFHILLLFILLLTACNMPSGTDSTVDGTMTALNAQSTQLAQQLADIAKATQIAVEVQSTVNAQQAAYMTVVAQATEVPPIEEIADLPVEQPTDLPAPTAMPLPTETQIPTLEPPTPTPDIEEWMETSNILLFEDIAGTLLIRYIKAALDGMGIPYVDVKDAVGDFKGQLLSGTDWDLIISGVEARSGVQGEFFSYLNDQVNRGSAVILEVWNLDDIGGAKATTLLTNCGVKFQKDWWNPPDGSRSIWWLVPEHPIFHEPNDGVLLSHYNLEWFGDAGDFLKKLPGSDATILAGNLAWEKDNHGTIAICKDGRFIIQTHSTHDYHQEDIMRLWQNYIYNSLKAHYADSHS